MFTLGILSFIVAVVWRCWSMPDKQDKRAQSQTAAMWREDRLNTDLVKVQCQIHIRYWQKFIAHFIYWWPSMGLMSATWVSNNYHFDWVLYSFYPFIIALSSLWQSIYSPVVNESCKSHKHVCHFSLSSNLSIISRILFRKFKLKRPINDVVIKFVVYF